MVQVSPAQRGSQQVTVGIDIGTTSVKAIAADADGNVVARTRVPHQLVVPAPDRLEHDANQAWRRGPRRALAALVGTDPLAVSVTSMVPSLVAVDRRGIARSPALLYGDVRGGRANQLGGGEAIGFLRWTAAQVPGAHGYWPAQAVANFALCGEGAMSTSGAFAGYPLYTGTGWDETVLGECGVTAEQLPRVVPDGNPVGKVGDAILDAGSIDALCEQLVAGADNDGDVLVICGTTLIVWAVIPEWIEIPGLWTIPHTAPGKMLIGGASNAGGLFLNWATNLAGRGRGDMHPGSVPVWSPYVRGERVPFHDANRRAALVDLDLTHDAASVRRAAYEASGFVVRHMLDLAGAHPRRIVASGGGTRVAEWIQALADCTGLPVDVVAVPEGAALGAAFLARMAAGLETAMTDAARWARQAGTIEPDAEWTVAAGERYTRFRELAEGAER
jgi:xylulokinase